MESVHQQISQCLKETIGKYYIFEEEELINIIDKLYNIFNNNKNQQKTFVKIEYTITTLNTMNKNNLKQLCHEYGIKTGNLKKNDLIIHIIDYQRGFKNEEECNSDISSITDIDEYNSIDMSVSMTTIKTTPICIIDGENMDDIEYIDVLENDIQDINYTSKEKKAKFTEMCRNLTFTKVIGYDIIPNQSDIDMYFEKQFEQGYLRKYNNIMYDKKLKRYMILEENYEYVHLNIKRFTKQILHIMINSNIEYCEKQEDEDINKYKNVFSTVLNKHKVYSPTFKTLQKNIEYIIKHISN